MSAQEDPFDRLLNSLKPYLCVRFALLLLASIGVLEGILGVFEVQPCAPRLILTGIAVLGGLAILGYSFKTQHQYPYRSWDRLATFLLVLVSGVGLGHLAFQTCFVSNRCPEVLLLISPDRICLGETAHLKVQAKDKEDDKLDYWWSANLPGLLLQGGPYMSPDNDYVAPLDSAGNSVEIKVKVNDRACGKEVEASKRVLIVRCAPTPKLTSTSIPTATITDISAATRIEAFTPAPTATQTFTPKPTATQTFTPTPTATQTFTPAPTATQTFTPIPAATQTFTPTPTKTRTPPPTRPPTPMPTPGRPSAPTLTNPPDGAEYHWGDLVTLQWAWQYDLEDDWQFAVDVWPADKYTDPERESRTWTKSNSFDLKLVQEKKLFPPDFPPGTYCWHIFVLRPMEQSEQADWALISVEPGEGDSRCFEVVGEDGPGPTSDPPGPTATPTIPK